MAEAKRERKEEKKEREKEPNGRKKIKQQTPLSWPSTQARRKRERLQAWMAIDATKEKKKKVKGGRAQDVRQKLLGCCCLFDVVGECLSDAANLSQRQEHRD